MIFVLITSCWAAVLKLIDWYAEEKWLLVTIDVIVLVTSVLVILEAASVIAKFRNRGSSTT
jgi:carbon starvation protein